MPEILLTTEILGDCTTCDEQIVVAATAELTPAEPTRWESPGHPATVRVSFETEALPRFCPMCGNALAPLFYERLQREARQMVLRDFALEGAP